MQLIQSEIVIDAPKKIVWDIILDTSLYHEWNPFTPKVETDFIVGNEIILHVNMTPGKKLLIQKEKILWIKEQESIAWGITSLFPVKTERIQELTEISASRTKYMTCDKFWGPLVPLVMMLYRQKIQVGFDQIVHALKHRAEALSKAIS